MELEIISPVHMRNSLQFSTSHEYHPGNQLQADKPHEIVHLVENTPPTEPYAQDRRRIATPTMPREENKSLKSSQRHQVQANNKNTIGAIRESPNDPTNMNI